MKSKPVHSLRRSPPVARHVAEPLPGFTNFGLGEFAMRFALVAEGLLAGKHGRRPAPPRPDRSEKWIAGL